MVISLVHTIQLNDTIMLDRSEDLNLVKHFIDLVLIRLQVSFPKALQRIIDLFILLSIAEIDYGLASFSEWATLKVELIEEFDGDD